MTADEAKALGYEIVAASRCEVGLLRRGQGIRTWWASDFGGELPPLDHPKVMEAISAMEEGMMMTPEMHLPKEPFDPKLRAAIEEIKPILKKYDVAAIVILQSQTHAEHLWELTPNWSCMKLEGGQIRQYTPGEGEQK